MPAADILIGSVRVFKSPVGTAVPDENDIGYGDAWPAGWTELGYTAAPLTANLEREFINKMVEQALSKVGKYISGETLTLETTLAEFTMDNLALAWGGTVIDTAAGAGQVGMEELKGGGSICLSTLQWGFEGLYQDAACENQWPVRFFCIGEAEMGGQLEFGKTVQTGIPLRVEASEDLDKPAGQRLYHWQKVTANATS